MTKILLALLLLGVPIYAVSMQNKQQNCSTNKRSPTTQDIYDEELQLLYMTFVYAKDLTNAKEVARIALQRYPRSIYWNAKMAEVLQWSGENEEAVRYMKRLYTLTHSEKIANKIVQFDLSDYRYEEALKFVEYRYNCKKDPKDLELLLFLYQNVALPDKAADLLYERFVQTHKKEYLLLALRIALDMGDMQRAKRYVKQLEMIRPYSYEQALLLANYHYIRREMKKAYRILLEVDESHNVKKDRYYKEYLFTKSDLGWFFQDTKRSVDASIRLIEMHAARQVDYERALLYYRQKDPTMSLLLAREGYERFKLEYLFFAYVNEALSQHHYKELEHFIQKVRQTDSKLTAKAMFWLVGYRVYSALGKKEKARRWLKRALLLQDGGEEFAQTLLWALIDAKESTMLKEVLLEFEDRGVSSVLYFPVASANLFLGNVDGANFYADLLTQSQNAITNSVEFLFLRAYIYQAQAREGLFIRTMRKIVAKMQKRMQQDPALLHDPAFMATYLRAAMYVEPADIFEKRLHQAKRIIKQRDFQEISYSFGAKRGSGAKAHHEAVQNNAQTLWVAFSDAISMYEVARLQKMLHRYLGVIAKSDAIEALDMTGQRALAQSIAFGYMLHNRRDEQGQARYIELVKKRSDILQAKTAWYRRASLQTNYLQLKNENYIVKGWSLQEGLRLSPSLSSLDDVQLYSLPSSLFYGYAGVAKMLGRGKVILLATYHNKLTGYMGFEARLDYNLRRDLSLKLEAAVNKDALETTSLLVGGKKESVSAQAVFTPLSSTSLELYAEFDHFKSDDDVALGNGIHSRAALMHTYHSAYPDIEFGAVVEGGNYSQKSGPHGIIDTIQPQDFAVLPQNYLSIGSMLSLGMRKRHLLTRRWRPYFQGGVFYNSENSDFNYALEAGLGGRVYRQDHLSIGASYSEFVRGVNDKVLEFYLDYEFYY